MKLVLDGQEIEYKDKEVHIHIHEPFYSAGKQFSWKGNTLGLGINEKIIEFAEERNALIFVTVGKSKRTYATTPGAIRKFCKEHNSFYETKGVKLYVVQWTRLMEVI